MLARFLAPEQSGIGFPRWTWTQQISTATKNTGQLLGLPE